MSCVQSVLYPTAGVSAAAGVSLPLPVSWQSAAAAACTTTPSLTLQLDLSKGNYTAIQRWPQPVAASLQGEPEAAITRTSANVLERQFVLPESLQSSDFYYIAVGDLAESAFFSITGPKTPFDTGFLARCKSDCCIDIAAPPPSGYLLDETAVVRWSAVGSGCGSSYVIDLMLDPSGYGNMTDTQRIASNEPTLVQMPVNSGPDGTAELVIPATLQLVSDYYYIRVTNTDALGTGYTAGGTSESSVWFFNLGGLPPVEGQRSPDARDRTRGTAGDTSAAGASACGASTIWSAYAYKLWATAAVACCMAVAFSALAQLQST